MDPALRRQRQMAGLIAPGASKFTENDLTALRECFAFFDLNSDGTMKTTDVPTALRAMGALVNDREVKVLTQKYDSDKVGRVTFDDYASMMSEVRDKPDDTNQI